MIKKGIKFIIINIRSKITSLIGAVGLKLVNIDEANLKFSGLRMIDVYDNFNLLT